MKINRRGLLGGVASCMAGSVLARGATKGAATTAAEPASSLQDKLAARAMETRTRLNFDGHKFSGSGWDRLVSEGAAAQFFLLGEEHGVAQIPMLTRELLLALRPAGYERLALEISAPVAAELDQAALHGVESIRRFNAEYPPGPAFYFMKEEAEFLAAVRPSFPAAGQLIWGLDYEVIQDRRLIARLKTRAPAGARAAVQALDDASAASWKKFEETKNPQFVFSFAGDPKLITDIRAVWPKPDPQSEVILDVLQGTLETNALWVTGRGWESNDRRTILMRHAFVRYWRAEKAKGRTPKTFFKFGASHMGRGRDMSEVYDIGDLVAEAATLEGGKSFHLFVGPPRTAKHGQFNPSTMSLMPVPAGYFDDSGVGFLADIAFSDSFTLIDLRALRPVLGNQTKDFDARATRVIHGFDAMLVLPGATPAVML
jgi:hypothetical protein